MYVYACQRVVGIQALPSLAVSLPTEELGNRVRLDVKHRMMYP
jgi:hypothetical protein